jgi:hypothetical protein
MYNISEKFVRNLLEGFVFVRNLLMGFVFVCNLFAGPVFSIKE